MHTLPGGTGVSVNVEILNVKEKPVDHEVEFFVDSGIFLHWNKKII